MERTVTNVQRNQRYVGLCCVRVSWFVYFRCGIMLGPELDLERR